MVDIQRAVHDPLHDLAAQLLMTQAASALVQQTLPLQLGFFIRQFMFQCGNIQRETPVKHHLRKLIRRLSGCGSFLHVNAQPYALVQKVRQFFLGNKLLHDHSSFYEIL